MPTVVFLRSPGPGAVFLWLERHASATVRPADLRLSDPAPPELWRALVAPSPLVDATLAGLAAAFGPEIVRLDWGDARWRWERGERSGGGDFAPRPAAVLERLPGWPRTPKPWEVWCREQGLPLARATDPRVPLVDYATVAGLDQRHLLVENAPRLYRFTLDAPV